MSQPAVHYRLSRPRRAPDAARRRDESALRRLAAYPHLRSQLPAIRQESNRLRRAETADEGWIRGVDFYPRNQLGRVLLRAFAQFHSAHGRYPNISEPQGFNEWVIRSKFLRLMKIPESGNKLQTQSFIPAQMTGRVSCARILYSGSRLDWEHLDRLSPGSLYYLKSSHGSGMCRRFAWPMSEPERRELCAVGERWLRHRFGLANGQWWYSAFAPMLLIEEDVGGNGFSVNCFCFRGHVALVVLHAQATGETITLTEQLELLGQQKGKSDWRQLFGRRLMATIVDLAAALSQEIEFARFDFLVGTRGDIFLGEVTFSPGNGLSKRPPHVDERLGRLWARSAGR